MKLERIEVRRLTLPLRTPFETSFGRTDVKQFLLVSASADGVTGLGECVADIDPFYLPETNETALHVLRDFLAPIALGLEIAHPRELLPAFSRVRGHEMAKAALEMAVFELWARRESKPLWRVPFAGIEYDVAISDVVFAGGVLLASNYWSGSKAIRLDESGRNPQVVWEGKALSLLMSSSPVPMS